jgi:low affinity Fe/Cu permease
MCADTRAGERNDRSRQGLRAEVFTRFAIRTAKELGQAWVLVVAVGVLIVWALSGPLLGFSDTWQLVISTSRAGTLRPCT